jgi:hypothetical protein
MISQERLLVFNKFVHKYGRLPTEFDPDYLEMLRMSKYIIVDVPRMQPGKCANCGASKNDGRKYVDFGLQVDWYGTVYLCGTCLHDVSNEMGLFNEIEQKLSLVIDMDERLAALKNQGVELHETVVKTFKEFENFYVSLHSSGVDSNPEPDSSGNSDTIIDEADTGGPSTNEAESGSTKPTSGRGSKNSRSLTDLLNSANVKP